MSLANTSGIGDSRLSGTAVFDLAVRADVRLLASVRATLRAWLDAHRIADDDCDAVVLACSEAIANSIEHAYAGDPDGIVVIAGHVDGSTIELSVHDSGAWVPPVAAGGSESRGRGLVLITQLMDAAAVDTRDGTTILMRRDRRTV